MNKTLYMLIGPKGAGKTYIGTLIAEKTDIPFMRVEKIWLSLYPREDGWQKVERAIDQAFSNGDKLMIENLGAGDGFRQFRQALRRKYRIKLIRVFCDLDICLERVKHRAPENQIPVSDVKIAEYNAIAARVKLDWAAEIDNTGPASDSEILNAFRNCR